MRPDHYRRVDELYHAAREHPAELRAAFLEQACGGDLALRREVELLLAAHERAGGFLASRQAGADETQNMAQTPSLVGRLFGAYEVLSPVGAGGMGEVYLARDTRLGRNVAIKLLPARHGFDSERIWRFEREARAASALNHPNIVTLYDIGAAEEGRFIIMEFVEGRTLRQMLAQGAIPDSISVIGGQIAKALAVAHAAGIVHRDVKPENIMVRRDGYVKVLDFGLARLMGESEADARKQSATHPGRVVGTVRYMSPEQARGEGLAAPSDVFSLGVVFYEMATGSHPFPGDSTLAILHAITIAAPARPSSLNAALLPPLENLILAMLEKEAAQRPTAAEVDMALAGVGSPEAAPRWCRSAEPVPSARRQNLPVQRTPFIGRSTERAALQPLLLDPIIRLITLTGPGGTGKTRLAVQIATDLAGHFPGGACFVNLAPISDPKLMLPAVAQALGVRDMLGRTLFDIVGEHLRGLGATLLILDNFEQLASAAPAVSELLDACPAVKAMVTSRMVLRVYGEQEFTVLPLPLPDADTPLSPGRLLDFPSIALFVQRAASVKPDFRLNVQNAAAVVEICKHLDGLPLAIELAAARVKVLPPAGLLARISSRLELLRGGAQDLPERQRTLRGTIDWSYDLLSPAEQKLFRRLSVFAGGCTLEAAEAVANCEEDLDADPFDAVTSLVDKSLLSRSGPADAEPRFTMLETLREYGRERLEQSGESDATRKAHAAYYLVLAEEGLHEVPAAEEEQRMNRWRAEHDNIRAALEYLIASGNTEWGLRLAAGLMPYWEHSEHLTEGRSALATLLDMPAAGAAIYRARALFVAGVLADSQLDFAATQRVTLQSLEIYRQLGDTPGTAMVLNGLAIQATRSGHYDRARSFMEEALALWKQLGTGKMELALSNLANIAKCQGDYETARNTYRSVVERFRAAGDSRGIASTLSGLGDVAAAEGDFAGARDCYEESLARFRQMQDQWGTAGAQRDLGNLARREATYDDAVRLYREALGIFRTLGHHRGMVRAFEHLALCAGAQRQAERALKLAAAAAGMRERLKTPILTAEREEMDWLLSAARAEIDEASRARIWEDGRSSSLEEMVRYALNDSDTCKPITEPRP